MVRLGYFPDYVNVAETRHLLFNDDWRWLMIDVYVGQGKFF